MEVNASNSNIEDVNKGIIAAKDLGINAVDSVYKYARANPKQAGIVAASALGGAALSTGDPVLIGGAVVGGGYLLSKLRNTKKFSVRKTNLANFASYPYFLDPEGSGNNIPSNRLNTLKKKIG